VIRIQAELNERQQALARVRQQAAAAMAKLAYLLGIDPCSELRPVDRKMMPLELVDASAPTCELVSQALRTGPGVQEMEGLLTLIQDSMAQAQGASRYIPILGVRMAEGAFGAGAGDSLTWDNRFDLGLQARWNLTEYVALRERRRASQAKMQQAHLAYQDLRNKLTAGVQEARSAVLSGREQIHLGEKQIRSARQARELSDERLKNNAPGSSYSEVLLSLGVVARAQLNYLLALSAYDKAQVRLLVLLGPGATAGVRPAANP
jgi:outer membrane protein TolC